MAAASQPIVTNDLNDIRAVSSAADLSVDLFAHFDDPSTTGLVARFELFAVGLGSRVKEVLLCDQAGAGAPLTVQNFLNYVNDGDYVNTIIHRSIPDSIIQGGGFTIDNLANNLANPTNAVGIIPTDPPVPNEVSSDRSNLRGTIAMANPEDEPNGATNQWFFNLGDNSADLDNQNGGSTVFCEVLSATDLAVIDAIAAVDIFNGSGLNPAFSDLPLGFNNPNNPVITGDKNFVRYSSITVNQRDELTFSISNNTNPGLSNVSIIDEQLVLDYLPDQFGTADITIQATNLLGQVIEETFSVTVDKILDGSRRRDTLTGTEAPERITGFQGSDRLTGGGGRDQFIYTSPVDGGDTITDFTIGEDQIVLTTLLERLGYNGSAPLADGLVQFRSLGSDTVVAIDPDGFEGAAQARNFLTVEGIAPAALNQVDNFIF